MKPIKILFVDDEKSILDLIEMYFEEEIEKGIYKLFFCDSAEDALELLESKDGQEISIIVTDINMPDMNGIELVKIINKRYENIVVYMMSAYGDNKTLKEVKKLKIQRYFNKPIDFDKLKEIIREDISKKKIITSKAC